MTVGMCVTAAGRPPACQQTFVHNTYMMQCLPITCGSDGMHRGLPYPACHAQSTIFSQGPNLDKAFTGAYRNARDWLMSSKGLTEDQAITLLTVACDFEIAQGGCCSVKA